MTPEQAKRARQTLEDVFTPDGAAVVIGMLRTFSPRNTHPDNPFRGKFCAQVTGRLVHKQWYAVADLKSKEDL